MINSLDYSNNAIQKMLNLSFNSAIKNFIEGKQYSFNHGFIAKLAILCRVPYSWMVNTQLHQEWDTVSFQLLDLVPLDREEFLSYLDRSLGRSNHVEAISVCFSEKTYFLRIELMKTFIYLDLFNPQISPADIVKISNCLQPFACNVEIHGTVIPDHHLLRFVIARQSIDLPDPHPEAIICFGRRDLE